MMENSFANVGANGDAGSIPGLRRSPEGGNGNQLQYSCLGNPMDHGAWWVTVHGGHRRIGHDLVIQQHQLGN